MGKRRGGVREELSTTIRDMRKAAGFRNMTALAEALGVSRQSVQKYETGQSVPGNRVLNRMVEVFGVSPDSAGAASLRRLAEGARALNGSNPARILFGEREVGDQSERAARLLALFRDYCGELDPSVEFTLERKIKKILEE